MPDLFEITPLVRFMTKFATKGLTKHALARILPIKKDLPVYLDDNDLQMNGHTSHFLFLYTGAFSGMEIVHKKVCKLVTKLSCNKSA